MGVRLVAVRRAYATDIRFGFRFFPLGIFSGARGGQKRILSGGRPGQEMGTAAGCVYVSDLVLY
jgi:hypothetical protein